MSVALKLPDDLDRHARGTDVFYGHTLNALRASDAIVQHGMYFFPEYTDHGKPHVEAVWAAAYGLIPLDAKGDDGPFTAEDACILVLGVLLHDIAMHLHLAGFRRLVQDDSPWKLGGEDAQAPAWSQMWRDYLIELGRWDGERIARVLGDHATAVPRIDLDGRELDIDARKLVGEFLRRHHPRLAHEIALHGFPDHDGAKPILAGIDRNMADMVGLIARSHGMSLRDCLDRLRGSDRHRVFRKVHILYLMALLRVADFVQLQADRAPAAALRQVPMESSISMLEWKTHWAIQDIRESDDAEAITIEIDPEDVHALLHARDWVRGLQDELDKCWAVLGEVYGTRQPLCRLGLRFRRVRDIVSRELPFHARHARFRLAGSDTIKLLIGPLYGHKPEVGIRELMQNAVDAVREREVVETEDGRRDWAAGDGHDVDIHIDVDGEGEPLAVEVRDNGIGMTADIVLNYFLVAGATFRRSDSWRDRFEEKPGADGSPGKVKVLRAGRFGVGALAAFLIGDEIEVTTRHRDAPPHDGVHFVAHVDDDAIQLNRRHCDRVGTTIRVKVGERQRKGVSRLFDAEAPREWDWFCQSWPRVRRTVGSGAPLAQRVDVTGDWFPAQGGCGEVSFLPRFRDNGPGVFICNGIRVCETAQVNWHSIWGAGSAVIAPHIHVVDKTGSLHLTMTRDALDGDADIVQNVARELMRHVIADCLANGPTGRWGYHDPSGGWAFSAQGFVPILPALLTHFADYEMWFSSETPPLTGDVASIPDKRMIVTGEIENYVYMALRFSMKPMTTIRNYDIYLGYDGVSEIERVGAWRVSAHPDRVHPYRQMLEHAQNAQPDGFVAMAICQADALGESGGIPARVWLDLIGPRFLPLDPEERRRQVPEAFETLAPLVEHYRKLGTVRE